MKQRILVTGGAGFIGSFLVDELIRKGHKVRVFDSIEPQVHGSKIPVYLNKEAEFVRGNMNDIAAVEKAIRDVDVVFHHAAAVGVGQSMYQIRHYVSANTLGTATLLDVLVNKKHDVKKLIVAASMSSYGEGAYLCESCGEVSPPLRSEEQMKSGKWELFCPECGKQVKPIPTKETKKQDSNSIYAITKKDQEEMVHNIGKAYGLPTVALRFFNVYGPRQSLNNPYTGVCAIFMSRIKAGNPPIVNEDGLQTRDFVSVHDIVQANILSMEKPGANYETFNVGNGKSISIKHIAETLIKMYGSDLKPEINNKYRKGDVRHCYADITKIKEKLGYKPTRIFEEGMRELIEWGRQQESVDNFEKATRELKEKGLL